MRNRTSLLRHSRTLAIALAALAATTVSAQPISPAPSAAASITAPPSTLRSLRATMTGAAFRPQGFRLPVGADAVEAGRALGQTREQRSVVIVYNDASDVPAETPKDAQAAAASERWQVTLDSGELYSNVALVDVRGEHLVIRRDGDTAMIPVEKIEELRLTRSWSAWRSIGYGAMAGGIAGYVAGAVSTSTTPVSTFLAAGLAGGALIGWLAGQVLSPEDDVYNMTGLSRLERTEMIGRLLTR